MPRWTSPPKACSTASRATSARPARQLLTRLVDDGFELPTSSAAAVKENRLALLPGRPRPGRQPHRRRDRGRDRPARGAADPDPPPARAARGRARRPRVQRRGRRGGPRRPSCSSTPASTRSAIVEITRVLGEGMARLAATITAAFAETFLQPRRQRGGGGGALRRAGRAADPGAQRRSWSPASRPTCATASAAAMLGRDELETGDVAGAQELAVCFADLVGFTRLGGQVELPELGHRGRPAGRPGRLGHRAAGAADQDDRRRRDVRQPGARPLVGGRAGSWTRPRRPSCPACAPGSPSARPWLRAGDYYGNSVNLASRVTGVARPGSVLCTQEVRDAAEDAFTGPRRAVTAQRRVRADAAVPGPGARLTAAGPDPARSHEPSRADGY